MPKSGLCGFHVHASGHESVAAIDRRSWKRSSGRPAFSLSRYPDPASPVAVVQGSIVGGDE